MVTNCAFERFSDGYYFGRLYVEPTTDARAQMCAAQHEWVNEQLYDESEQTDRPLAMKLGSHHLAAHGDERVPADTLPVPEFVLSETPVRNPPTLRDVAGRGWPAEPTAQTGRRRRLILFVGSLSRRGETTKQR